MKKITRLSAFRTIRWKITNPKTLLYLITVIIVMVGLFSAILIYLTADNDSDRVLDYEAIAGHDHSIASGDSNMYRHDLELHGGKASVLVDEFIRWFVGLWHGKSLAFVVACITFFISFAFFFVAYYSLSDPKSDARDGNNEKLLRPF